MNTAITEDEKELMREIDTDPTAVDLLKAKCRWEGMSRFGVLREWGDPRTWPSYPKPAQEEGK